MLHVHDSINACTRSVKNASVFLPGVSKGIEKLNISDISSIWDWISTLQPELTTSSQLSSFYVLQRPAPECEEKPLKQDLDPATGWSGRKTRGKFPVLAHLWVLAWTDFSLSKTHSAGLLQRGPLQTFWTITICQAWGQREF